MGKKKFGIMGNGYLAGIIVDGYLSGLLDEYELVGVMGRTPDKTAAIAGRGGCKACGTVEELLALKPDVVAEAASVQCIRAVSYTHLDVYKRQIWGDPFQGAVPGTGFFIYHRLQGSV